METHILSCTCLNYKLKILKKRCQEKWNNAYLTLKNTRASRALRRALDPGLYMLASLALRRFAPSANLGKKLLGPPPLTKSGIRTCVDSTESPYWLNLECYCFSEFWAAPQLYASLLDLFLWRHVCTSFDFYFLGAELLDLVSFALRNIAFRSFTHVFIFFAVLLFQLLIFIHYRD